MLDRGKSMARTIRLAGLIAIPLAALAAGCVDRKFIIESNVPNAQVYIDNRSVGAAPAYSQFEYYGHYTITLVHPGYETLVKRVHVTAPWYAYPPFDFITEVLWPFRIRDTRRYNLEMFQAQQIRTDDILNAAEALRQRGMTLPPPERPAEPRQPRNPAPVIGPPVEVGPGPTPLPPPRPVPAPGPVSGPEPAPGIVPRVAP
jgi:hypothetical protein